MKILKKFLIIRLYLVLIFVIGYSKLYCLNFSDPNISSNSAINSELSPANLGANLYGSNPYANSHKSQMYDPQNFFHNSTSMHLNKHRVNIKRKLKEIKQLTQNAYDYLEHQPLDKALHNFNYLPKWSKGEISVFVLDENGIFYSAGEDKSLIWKNIDLKRENGKLATSIIKEMLSAGEKGRYISYIWKNSYHTVFVKTITKNSKKFVIGSGFYPADDQFVAMQLVKTAVNYFYTEGPQMTFSMMTGQSASFIHGDIYTFAYDLRGQCYADGQNSSFVGQNLIDLQDSRGKYIVKEMVDLAKKEKKGWLSYHWRNELKKTYVERVVDPKTKKVYLIGAGYYPNLSLHMIKNYVHLAIRNMQEQGTQNAFSNFTSLASSFNKGGLGIFVYNFNGICLANGENPALVGQNMIDKTDQNGKYIVKEMIKAAKAHKEGVLHYHENNAYTVAYIERVDLAQGKFIVGAQYHPLSKSIVTKDLVERASKFLRSKDIGEAFGEFTKFDSKYIQGDLNIFVYDKDGISYITGLNKSNIWRNYKRANNQYQSSVTNKIISQAIRSGSDGAWTEYRVKNDERVVFAKPIIKKMEDGSKQTFIVGSGYFL